eukprot:TRINITY_DN14470_c0_g1_i1.p1 TRINITY_DN14470_c0_g1~~TRINITY_DN14470_c0_g1_i1.p1  ORF type:complete len:1830 (+),score=627.14 TRINITY_DN14470_c0_g1_i1:99-5492(+)
MARPADSPQDEAAGAAGAAPAPAPAPPFVGVVPSLPRVRRCIERIEVWETPSRLYVFGSDAAGTTYRILQFDRTTDDLCVTDDDFEYTAAQHRRTISMLQAAHPGGRGKPSMTLAARGCGILGAIRFTKGYTLVIITKRRRAAQLGPHVIYEVADTELISISSSQRHPSRQPAFKDDTRYRDMFLNFDLKHDFYFCHTYDFTNNLQYNVQREHRARSAAAAGQSGAAADHAPNDMFWWNAYLLLKLRDQLKDPRSPWLLPCAHGFVAQVVLHALGRRVHMLLCARRSRYFAGTRFLKRGIGDDGHVANHIEVEQIVYDASSLSLCGTVGTLTSLVQVRGSIPVFWHQPTSDQKVHRPRPPIKLGRNDPDSVATKLHFADLFAAYGTPLVVLDLLKQKEKAPREQMLSSAYRDVIGKLNQRIPAEHQIGYIGWDFRSASRSHPDKVLNDMASIAEEVLAKTGMFATGPDGLQQQQGTVRTNCVDCLDRTNLAQFFIGKCALSQQLAALGVAAIADPDGRLPAASAKLHESLLELYVQMGDRIALQYGGSRAQSAGVLNRGALSDIVTTLTRYYNNNFVDLEKQKSINVFLGNYTPNVPRVTEDDSARYGGTASPVLPPEEVGRRYAFARPIRFLPPPEDDPGPSTLLSQDDAAPGTPSAHRTPQLCLSTGELQFVHTLPDNIKVLEMRAERAAALGTARAFEPHDVDRRLRINDDTSSTQTSITVGESATERRVVDLWEIESDYYLHLQTPLGPGPPPVALGPQWWEAPLAIFAARWMHPTPPAALQTLSSPHSPTVDWPRLGDAGLMERYPTNGRLTEWPEYGTAQVVDDLPLSKDDDLGERQECRHVELPLDTDDASRPALQQRMSPGLEGRLPGQCQGGLPAGPGDLYRSLWRERSDAVDGVAHSDQLLYHSHLGHTETLFAESAPPWGQQRTQAPPWAEFQQECRGSCYFERRRQAGSRTEWLSMWLVCELVQHSASRSPRQSDRIRAEERLRKYQDEIALLGNEPPGLARYLEHAALRDVDAWDNRQRQREPAAEQEYDSWHSRLVRVGEDCCMEEADALRHGPLWRNEAPQVLTDLRRAFRPYLAVQLADSTEADIVSLVAKLHQGMQRADRMRHTRNQLAGGVSRAGRATEGLVRSEVCHSTFLARQAVDFVLANLGPLGLREQTFLSDPEPRRVAAQFLNLFVKGGVFHHVLSADARPVPFTDGFRIFRFMQDEHLRVLNLARSHSAPLQAATPEETVGLSQRLMAQARAVWRAFELRREGEEGELGPADFIKRPICQDLASAVCQLQCANLSVLEEDADKVAFWVNVHNVLEVHAQLAVGVMLLGTQTHRQVMRSTSCYLVGGHVLSLDTICHGILRGNRRAPTTVVLKPSSGRPLPSQQAAYTARSFDISLGNSRTHSSTAQLREEVLEVQAAESSLGGNLSIATHSRPTGSQPVTQLHYRLLRSFGPNDPRRALAVRDPDPRFHFALLDLTSDEIPNFTVSDQPETLQRRVRLEQPDPDDAETDDLVTPSPPAVTTAPVRPLSAPAPPPTPASARLLPGPGPRSNQVTPRDTRSAVASPTTGDEPPGTPPGSLRRLGSHPGPAAAYGALRTPRGERCDTSFVGAEKQGTNSPQQRPSGRAHGAAGAVSVVSGSISVGGDDGGYSSEDEDAGGSDEGSVTDQGKAAPLSFFEQWIAGNIAGKKQVQRPFVDIVLCGQTLGAQLRDIVAKQLLWGIDVTADESTRALTLPRVFFRYGEDFGFTADEKVRRLTGLLPPRDRRRLVRFTQQPYTVRCESLGGGGDKTDRKR